MTTPSGTSSIAASSLNSTLFAVAGALNVNVSAAICASVFHSLMRSVYCGMPVTVLLVMTYLRGIGRAPVSIQICQSDLRRAEREMLAFDTVDHALADVLGVDRVSDQPVVSIGQQKVRAGRLDGELVPQLADEVIDRAGGGRLRVRAVVPVVNGEGLAVEDELHVVVAAGAGGAEPVGRLSSAGPSW